MDYDSLKDHRGQPYSGMSIGGEHRWLYDGGWYERKLSPIAWELQFDALKTRQRPAPVGSGASLNSQYEWIMLVRQRVRKLTWDSYETCMVGTKWKAGHKRPHWARMSYEYPEQAGHLWGVFAQMFREAIRLVRSYVALDDEELTEMFQGALDREAAATVAPPPEEVVQ